MTPENQGGENPIDSTMSRSRNGNGRTTLGIDARQEAQVLGFMDKLTKKVDTLTEKVNKAHAALGRFGSNLNTQSGGNHAATPTGSTGSVSSSMASSMSSISAPSSAPGASSAAPTTTSAAGIPASAGNAPPPTLNPSGVGGAAAGGSAGAGGGGGGGSFFSDAGKMPGIFTDKRIAIGAEYSLQADRMTAQYQQMYGKSNAEIRNGVRMPLAGHYMLGGADAINQMMNLQASTGLSATKQASSVESMRAITGFSLDTAGATKMIAGMSSPDVANRMFMMGGMGMYGIGGKENTAMGNIQNIVRRAGLTNAEALKGALQPGSNTRQRLTAMGVPEDMQDMVIQYAMENTQFQKKTNGKEGMYDPSQEKDRKTMGIEGNYITQHEKTTGEKIKREERFYGRQADNFADFEKNLRTATKMLENFEDALSGIVGGKISVTGHPAMNAARTIFGNKMGVGSGVLEAIKGIFTGGGDGNKPGTSSPAANSYSTKVTTSTPRDSLPASDERKLSALKPELAEPLRNMMLANSKLYIYQGYRSYQEQETEFRKRYEERPDLTELPDPKHDRMWNGVVWVKKKGSGYDLAAPGESYHTEKLAADVFGDNEWVRSNAAAYGLDMGGTSDGSTGDEPFHVQPKGTMRTPVGKYLKSIGATKSTTPNSKRATVQKATLSKNSKNYVSARKTAKKLVGIAGQASAASVSSEVTSAFNRIEGIDKPVQTSYKVGGANGGDGNTYGQETHIGGVNSGGSYGSGSIVISPNIYLTGSQDSTGDIRRIAKEVGRLLESEVKLVMMRQS